MPYILHIQWPISRWLITYMSKDLLEDGLYLLIQQVLHHVEHTTRYVTKMIVVTTGGEYCNFHRVNTCEISSQVSQTNTTRMFSVLLRTRMRTGNSSNNAIALLSGSSSQAHILDFSKTVTSNTVSKRYWQVAFIIYTWRASLSRR